MFGKEPTVILGAISEVLRQIIPMLILFGIIHWDGQQVAQVMAVVSAVIAALTIILTRSQVTPTQVADKQIQEAINTPKGSATVENIKESVANKEEK